MFNINIKETYAKIDKGTRIYRYTSCMGRIFSNQIHDCVVNCPLQYNQGWGFLSYDIPMIIQAHADYVLLRHILQHV